VGLRGICSHDSLSQQSSTPVALIGGAGVPGRARLRGTRVLGATFRSSYFPRLGEGGGGKRERKRRREEDIVLCPRLCPLLSSISHIRKFVLNVCITNHSYSTSTEEQSRLSTSVSLRRTTSNSFAEESGIFSSPSFDEGSRPLGSLPCLRVRKFTSIRPATHFLCACWFFVKYPGASYSSLPSSFAPVFT
jgi:hypothetical protein